MVSTRNPPSEIPLSLPNLNDAFETCATEEGILVWGKKSRADILEWVDPIPIGDDQFVYDRRYQTII